MFNRAELVDKLVADDVDFIENCGSDGRELLFQYLTNGFVGYSNFTDFELKAEAEERDIIYDA